MLGWFKRKLKNKTKSSADSTPLKVQEKEESSIKIKQAQEEIPDSIELRKIEDSDEVGVIIDGDALPGVSQDELGQYFSEKTGTSLFEGKIKYGFDLKKVKSSNTCPKCQGKLTQHFSNILYTDGNATRVNTCPFGYFCDSCPTVVIDVLQLSKSLNKGVKFRAIAGLDTAKNGTMLFEEWNNEKPVFVMDEYEQLVDVITKKEARQSGIYSDSSEYYQSWGNEAKEWRPSPKAKKQKSRNRKKNKSAKKARRKHKK